MAEKVLRIPVCDVCGSEVELTQLTIQVEKRKPVSLLLCADRSHGMPMILKLMDQGSYQTRTSGDGRRGRGRVVTLEEIEKMKAERGPAAP